MAADLSNTYTKGLARLLPNMEVSSLDPSLVDRWTDENGNPIDKDGNLKSVKIKPVNIPTSINPLIVAANTKVGSKAFTQDKDGKVIITYTGNPDLDKIIEQESKALEAKKLEFNKSENELAKKASIGNLALNAGAGILGIGQAIGGAKVLKGLKAPKYPYELLPNQQLAARIGDVQRLSQIGDPVIREKMYRDLVLEKNKQDAVAQATSGGDISSYAAQTQANAGRMSDNIRDIATSELWYKSQQGNILDGLIAQKMAEDRAIHKGRIDKFNNVDMPEYEKRRSYGEQLVNKGIGNIFTAGTGAMQDGTVLARTAQNERLFNKPQVTSPTTLPVNTTSTTPANMNLSEILPSAYNTMGIGSLSKISPSNMNLSEILPSAYNTMGIGSLSKISPYQPIVNGNGSLLLQPQANTVPTPNIQPTVLDKNYGAGDMSYMTNPQGYSQYLGKVAKLTPEQILEPYKSSINPKTNQLYNIADVPMILKGMTDGKIGAKHRMAQSLINQYGY